MKNNQLQKNDDAGRIARAMETIRQRPGTQAQDYWTQESRIARPPEPETFVLHCWCAKFDQPYKLLFARQPSGLWRYSESIRGQASTGKNNLGAGNGVGAMRLDRFEPGRTPCAWCGDASFHHCANDCGQLVCGGRMVGNTFHCRPSCGAVWVGVPLQEVQGIIPQQQRQSMAAPPRPVTPMAPRPVARHEVAAGGRSVLLLTAGKDR